MFKKIIVGTDFSESAEMAWQAAIQLARRLSAELVLVHVEEPLPAYAFSEGALPMLPQLQEEVHTWAERELTTRAAQARADGVSITTAVLIGTPADALVEAAQSHGADLIVVGTHGRTGLERVIIGSVAERVVRAARCPVLTVKNVAPAQEPAKPKVAA